MSTVKTVKGFIRENTRAFFRCPSSLITISNPLRFKKYCNAMGSKYIEKLEGEVISAIKNKTVIPLLKNFVVFPFNSGFWICSEDGETSSYREETLDDLFDESISTNKLLKCIFNTFQNKILHVNKTSHLVNLVYTRGPSTYYLCDKKVFVLKLH